MDIRKVLAGGLAAITAGATIALGAAAITSMGDYVTTIDGTLSSPIIVIGDTVPAAGLSQAEAIARTKDVLGAADIAAAVAGYATTTVATGAGAAVAVSGGADVSKTGTKLYLGDNINSVRTKLRKADLPTILASGSLTVAGTTYTYDQYINIGSSTIAFGNSDESIDPVLYVDVGTSADSPVYTTTVRFDKALNVSNSKVQGKKLTLFTKDYTIGSGSDNNTLLLYGYGVTETLTLGSPVTITIGEIEYTVEATWIGSDQLLLKVNGVTSDTLAATDSDVISGLNIYVKSILASTVAGIDSMAIVSLGAEKLVLEDTKKVKVGEALTPIDGTTVAITGAGGAITKLEIKVAAEDTTADYIGAGSAFTDPVFESFKVAFNGLTPAFDAATRETISLGTSGNDAATIKFTDYRGNEKQLIFAVDNDTETGIVTPILADGSKRVYHVIEGEAVKENEYVLVSKGDDSGIFQLTDIDDVGESTAKIELTDVMSGVVKTINLQDDGYTSATGADIGGVDCFVNATSTEVKITWDANATDGAAPGDPGIITTLFPLIRTNNEALVTFFNNATVEFGSTDGIYYELPGGIAGTTIVLITNDTDSVDTAGEITYTFTASTDNTTLTQVAGVAISNHPFVLVLEEKGKNLGGVEVRDAILAQTASYGDAPARMAISSTVTLTAVTKDADKRLVSNTYTIKSIDRYGTLVTQNTYEQGTLTISYPDDQAVATVGIGADPTFSVGGVGTVEAATKITSPVSKLASEVSSTAPGADLILIGGPCANALTAAVMAADNVTCGDWNYTTGIIKEYTGAFTDGKKALVVAGTTADDTRALCAKVMNNELSYGPV